MSDSPVRTNAQAAPIVATPDSLLVRATQLVKSGQQQLVRRVERSLLRILSQLRSTGTIGLAGLGLLGLALVCVWTVVLPQRDGLASLREQLATAQAQANSGGPSATTNQAQQSSDFIRKLPLRRDLPAILGIVLQQAEAAKPESGEWQLRVEGEQGRRPWPVPDRAACAWPLPRDPAVRRGHPGRRTGCRAGVAALCPRRRGRERSRCRCFLRGIREGLLMKLVSGPAAKSGSRRALLILAAGGRGDGHVVGAGRSASNREDSDGGAGDFSGRGPQQGQQFAFVPRKVASVVTNLFGGHSWFVAPPPPPMVVREPPAPSAPPLPFTLLGSYSSSGGAPVYFLVKGDSVYDVHVGDVIDSVYSVDGVSNGRLNFTYLPLKIGQSLAVGSTP